MPFDVTVSQKDQTLPMILTLRGDETIVEEFTYDTDQAMSYLGIKRSRLNQISGRELRVARIRRDRYIRPVYRECDLKDYLDWTRATATHLSSSKAIEQAVENLDDRFNDVLQVFNEKIQQVSHDQKVWMKGELERLPFKFQSLAQPLEDLGPVQEYPWHREDKLLRAQSDHIKLLQKDIKAVEIRVREIQGMLNFVVPEMKELNVSQKSLRLDFDQRFEAMASQFRDFHQMISRTAQREEEFFEATREFFNPSVVVEEAAVPPIPEEAKAAKVSKPRRRRECTHRSSRRYGAS